MLNIKKAIENGNWSKNADGSYTVFGDVQVQNYDIATTKDVLNKKAYIEGACINYRIETQKVSCVVNTLYPNVKNFDIVETDSGNVEIQDIEEDSGECKLYPLDGQCLNLPGVVQEWGWGNIYQLPSSQFKVAVAVND